MKSTLSLRVNNMDAKEKERREGKYSSVRNTLSVVLLLT